MDTTTEKNFKKIREAFSRIAAYVELSNATGQTDINSSLENFFIPILNKVLNTNLRNANKDSINYPAIDLYDLKERIAIQVTSDDGSEKKKETHKKFYEKEMDKKFDFLIMFYLKTSTKITKPKIYDSKKNILSFKDLRLLYLKLWTLHENDIQEIADHIDKKLVSALEETPDFSTPKKIEINENDIRSFIYKSGQFIGSENPEEDVKITVSTYNQLFNKVNKLSEGAKRLLAYIIINNILNENKLNFEIQAYYVYTASLVNRLGETCRPYITELIATGLASIEDEIMREYFDHNCEGLRVFFRGDLVDGNAFAFLYDYLDYDEQKLTKVLVEMDFSALK